MSTNESIIFWAHAIESIKFSGPLCQKQAIDSFADTPAFYPLDNPQFAYYRPCSAHTVRTYFYRAVARNSQQLSLNGIFLTTEFGLLLY